MGQDGRVAVITGAAGGIGGATAEALLERGWTVYGWDVKKGADARVRWRTVDVADAAAVEKAAAEVGAASFLLNAAGVGVFAPAKDIDAAQWHRVMGINLDGTFFAAHYLHPALKAGKGVVVNIASAAGLRTGPNRAMYSTSKAAIVMLSQVLAVEWAADGIRVFSICPGYVRTPMVQEAFDTGRANLEAALSRIPQHRLIEPREMAEAIIALSTDTFAALTGQTVVLDSGWMSNAFE